MHPYLSKCSNSFSFPLLLAHQGTGYVRLTLLRSQLHRIETVTEFAPETQVSHSEKCTDG